MWFVLIGVALLVMWLGGIGPVGEWTWSSHWWALCLPFGLAAVWWWWSDTTGRTQRLAMDKVAAKREARRQKAVDAMGVQNPRKRR
ncbi:TIGR04438 family Trp-rich protein [Aquabacterium olei]|jgi:small Trp-rich protein|uniref:TIGR04438 family Trp-rich protein n=1 Tax=Aquabacterium olei TaxID=1296669 RepID=A0A2U8FSG5_9BURK|nr:TIGR04438 family Trp-rich protein [Aquabacterium olei]AWI53950.1 TIGR04438 family Trp-rich protein [Aquabacterium olei]